ncbi:MAG: TAXI family TRAP transporter solute-binding subunit [Planctomycetota bacterium]
MKENEKSRRRFGWKIFGPSVLVTILAFVIAAQFVRPAPPEKMRIAAGPATGAYYGLARRFQEIFREEGFELEIVETEGAVKNLSLLEKQKVDAAFLQGGIASGSMTGDIVGLASLYLEPVWVFLRDDLEITLLGELAGKKIAIGPQNSGTHHLAIRLLSANGVDVESAELLELGSDEAAKALIAGELDAMIIVSGVSSATIEELLRSEHAHLYEWVRAEAYSRRRRSLSPVLLPRGVMSLREDIPARDIHLVAAAAFLAAHEDLHPALITLLMIASKDALKEGGVFAEPGEFPSSLYLDVPQSEEARRFLELGPSFLFRYLPFWAADLLDRLKVMLLPLLTILFPLIKILPPMYRWRIRRRVYRWYDDLRRADLMLEEAKTADDLAPARQGLAQIEDEILQVDVPPSYCDELFDFRLHLRLIKNRLHEREEQLTQKETEHE